MLHGQIYLHIDVSVKEKLFLSWQAWSGRRSVFSGSENTRVGVPVDLRIAHTPYVGECGVHSWSLNLVLFQSHALQSMH